MPAGAAARFRIENERHDNGGWCEIHDARQGKYSRAARIDDFTLAELIVDLLNEHDQKVRDARKNRK